MPKTKLSALAFVMAAVAFLMAGLLSLRSNGSPLAAVGFSGVAILFLVNAFVFWRKPGA